MQSYSYSPYPRANQPHQRLPPEQNHCQLNKSTPVHSSLLTPISTQLVAMLRSGAAGSLGRVLCKPKPSTRALSKPLARSTTRPLRPSSLALTTYKGFSTSLQRYQTSDRIDIKHEKDVAKQPLEPHPEQVSSVSSVHQVFHEQGVKEEEKDEDMLAGIKGDWVNPYLRPPEPGQHFTDRWYDRRK